ncbi:MAG TPA: phage tail protein, partial [Spirochaetia bacterium]|nr:phage tail protein [Spirochaetia bacterium]
MSSKIKILNSSLAELATINVASSARRTEKINSDNILNFSIRVKSGLAAYINDTNVIELDSDYFDIAYYKKEQQGDGKLMVNVECEHVSYRLNDLDYDLEYFTETGTPTEILTAILAGTGFTVGTVDFVDSTTFSLQEAASRRRLLMQFAAYMGGELEFKGFQISLLTQRGSSTPTALTVGKDVTIISKAVDKRHLDENGNPTVSYTCGVYKGAALSLGDVVTLDYDSLDIDVSLRIVSKSWDPYNPNNVTIEVGNYVNSLEDDLYRIETNMLAKGKTYYGARISADNGFESIRSDKMARGVFNADLFALQVGDGSGSNWTNKLYFDPVTGKYIFDGALSTTMIEALEAEFDVTVSNTVIVQNLYAARGNIAEL